MRTTMQTMAATVLGATTVALVAAAVSVQAASKTDNLTASASVANNCTITTAALAFGAYDPVVANAASPLDGTGTVTVACTKNASTTIDLGNGANFSGTRRMTDGTDFLSYLVFSDAGRTTAWGTGAGNNVAYVAPDKNSKDLTAFGRVTAGQDVDAGNYSDTIVATINF